MKNNSTFSKIIGHRGARAELLENSLMGFQYVQSLINKGLAGIEFDVQLTSDNQLVVFHDDTLDRLYGRQGRMDQLPAHFFQLNQPKKQYNANISQVILQSTAQTTKQQTITLQEMPSLLIGYRHIELEIKTHERTNYQLLIQVLIQQLANFPKELPISLTSFDTQVLLRLQAESCLKNSCLKEYPRGLLIEDPQPISEIINTALRLQCKQVGVMASLINEALIEKCQRYGISITAWTVNEIQQSDELINKGVDWIITDYPSQFLAR